MSKRQLMTLVLCKTVSTNQRYEWRLEVLAALTADIRCEFACCVVIAHLPLKLEFIVSWLIVNNS